MRLLNILEKKYFYLFDSLLCILIKNKWLIIYLHSFNFLLLINIFYFNIFYKGLFSVFPIIAYYLYCRIFSVIFYLYLKIALFNKLFYIKIVIVI